jgi:hypothetical protein
MKIKLSLVAVMAMGFLASQASYAKLGFNQLNQNVNTRSVSSCQAAISDLAVASANLDGMVPGSKGYNQALGEFQSALSIVSIECAVDSIGGH